MKQHRTQAAGFSLVELMVAMVAGLIVTAAVLAFTFSSMKSNGEYVVSTRLTQELRNTLELVTRDLRRAGYDENALSNLATGNASPFGRVEVLRAGNTNSCVLYAYDRESSGSFQPGVLDFDNGEVRGVRLVSQTVNGVNVGIVEYAESSASGDDELDCDASTADYTKTPVACNATTHWCALSDPRTLDITAFTITDNSEIVGTSPNQVRLRDLVVRITGRPVGNTEYTRDVVSTVRIRTDCFDATIANCILSP